MLGWLLASWLQGRSRLHRVLGWIALAGSSAGAQAPVACLCTLVSRVSPRLPPGLWSSAMPIAVGAVASVLVVAVGNPRETLTLALGIALACALVFAPTAPATRPLSVLLVGVVVAAAGANRSFQLVAWDPLDPVLVHSDRRGDAADVARWSRRHTPENAVFLTPPDLSEFRLLGRRALVVDHKAVPFDDAVLAEWRERLRVCYGDVRSGGFAGLREMDDRYRSVTAETLRIVRARYGARFAVLYAGTATEHAVLYENPSYRLVELLE